MTGFGFFSMLAAIWLVCVPTAVHLYIRVGVLISLAFFAALCWICEKK